MGQCSGKVKSARDDTTQNTTSNSAPQRATSVHTSKPSVAADPSIVVVSATPSEGARQQQQQQVDDAGNQSLVAAVPVKRSSARSTSSTGSDHQQRIQETLDSLFPNFKALTAADPQWQKEIPEHCPGCTTEIDFLVGTTNCRACGRIFCDRCCYRRPAIQNEKICGTCMAAAMATLRRRELSQMEVRVKRNSELLRRRNNASSCSNVSNVSNVSGGSAGAAAARSGSGLQSAGGAQNSSVNEVELSEIAVDCAAPLPL